MIKEHHVTLVLATVLAVAPQFIPILPPIYRDAATAFLAFVGSLYHLYVTPP